MRGSLRSITLIASPVLIFGLGLGFAPAALAASSSPAALISNPASLAAAAKSDPAPLLRAAAASPGAGNESIVPTLLSCPALPIGGQDESAAPAVSAAIV